MRSGKVPATRLDIIAPATVTEQRKTLPTQLIGNAHDFGDILPDIVAGVCGAEAAVAMARTVQRYHMQVVHMGQHHIKAGGIVEPAMQGNNRVWPLGCPTLWRRSLAR